MNSLGQASSEGTGAARLGRLCTDTKAQGIAVRECIERHMLSLMQKSFERSVPVLATQYLLHSA